MDVWLDGVPEPGLEQETDLVFDDPHADLFQGDMPLNAEGRPYHTKRPHRKSRLGCKNCKTRKVKCDEVRPVCRNCTVRRDTCVWATRPPARSAAAPATASSSKAALTRLTVPSTNSSNSTHSARAASSPAPASPVPKGHSADNSLAVISEPYYMAPSRDLVDMKLLWNYTNDTFASFAIEAGRVPEVDNILKNIVVQQGFTSPFLMDCILGLSALHMQHRHQEVPESRAINYRARAFAGYRHAIEKGDPNDFPALATCSLLLCALSSECFREKNAKPLYILDWMVVWRGIGIIIGMLPQKTLINSGIQMLFARPSMDLNQAASFVPNYLLFMIASIKPDDPDYEHINVYYETLRYVGSLYQDLDDGFTPILNLRVITFFTFLPEAFIDLAKQKRPRAILILGHYMCFTKIVTHPWWMANIGDREIQNIVDFLGPEYANLMQIPKKVMGVTDKTEMARILLGDNQWTSLVLLPRLWNVQNPVGNRISLVDDKGVEIIKDENGDWIFADAEKRKNGALPTFWSRDPVPSWRPPRLKYLHKHPEGLPSPPSSHDGSDEGIDGQLASPNFYISVSPA